MPKSAFKIFQTVPLVKPVAPLKPRTLRLPSAETKFWMHLMFSGVQELFGLPLFGLSLVLVSP